MRPKRRLAWGGVVGGLLLLAVACGSEGPTPSPGGPPTPNIQATIEALAQRPVLGTPTPTPVPAAARAVAVEFATGHRAIDRKWDTFQGKFDSWREGLVACDASSVRVVLQQFGGRFSSITEATRALPRPSVLRGLADKLIEASEKEGEALRFLRDTWRPEDSRVRPAPAGTGASKGTDDGDQDDRAKSGARRPTPAPASVPVPASVFERVQAARSAAASLRKEVADALGDRADKTTKASLAEVATFSSALKALDLAWNEFHLEYDAFRSQQSELSSTRVPEELGKLVDRFRDSVAAAVVGLPANDATQEVADMLAKAAEEEELLLRKLRGMSQKGEAPETGGKNADSKKEGAGGEAASGSGSVDTFKEFDTLLVKTNAIRRQAAQEMKKVADELSEETKAEAEAFTGKYDLLSRQWDEFHRDYDEWRRIEGGCDRAKAIDTLGRFNVDFAAIVSDVQGLPSATVLRPLGEILVEAAEREGGALRGLRNTWQPFDVNIFDHLDRERNTAGKLRRQVTVGVQELLERYGISAK